MISCILFLLFSLLSVLRGSFSMIIINRFIFLVLLLILPWSAFAGIRWTDTYPFHRPNGVSVSGVQSTFSGVLSDAERALLKGDIRAVVDDSLLNFNAFKNITRSDVASLGLGLVKGVGPSMLIASLVPLVWNELLKIWEKPNPNNPIPYSGSLYNNNSACMTTPIGAILYGTDGSACTRTCQSPPHPAMPAPWSGLNNQTDSSYNHDCPKSILGPGYEGQYFISHTWRRMGYIPVNQPNVPATDAEILAALMNYLADINKFIDFINKLIARDKGQDVYNSSDPDHLTGPALLTRTSTVTSTGPDGQTTVQTTNKYDITYPSNSVSITRTITVTTTGPDGIPRTVVTVQPPTTSPGGGGGGGDTPPPVTEQLDICVEHPEIIACGVGGTVEDITLPTQEKPMSLSSEKTSVGTCPADISFTVRGHAFVVSWSPVCTFASSIRPLVILIAWLTAGIFVFFTLSRV